MQDRRFDLRIPIGSSGGRRVRQTLTVVAVSVLLLACSNLTTSDQTPDLPAVPGDPSASLSVLEMVLVRDTEHAAQGDQARQNMLASTMLYQRLLSKHFDLHFDVREWNSTVDLNPATVTTGETDVTDYLTKFTSWKQSNVDEAGRTYLPFAALYSYQDFGGTVGSGYVGEVGAGNSTSISTHNLGSYGDLAGVRAAYSARYLAYNLGGSPSSHGESGYILSAVYDWISPPTEYHPNAVDDIQSTIDSTVASRGAIPTVDAHPLGVATSADSVTLAWDFGDASSTFTVYRNTESVPVSCFDCTSVFVGSQAYTIDTTVQSGIMYHYRVVARDSSGNLIAVSNDTIVSVP